MVETGVFLNQLGSSAVLSFGLRPEALRPHLSEGLPFSGSYFSVISYYIGTFSRTLEPDFLGISFIGYVSFLVLTVNEYAQNAQYSLLVFLIRYGSQRFAFIETTRTQLLDED